jgi:hypothetical protein
VRNFFSAPSSRRHPSSLQYKNKNSNIQVESKGVRCSRHNKRKELNSSTQQVKISSTSNIDRIQVETPPIEGQRNI